MYSPIPKRRVDGKDGRLAAGRIGNAHLEGHLSWVIAWLRILLRIQQISGERLEILKGSFYTAIYRLECRGRITGEQGESENNRKAKFYRRTASGKRQLKEETKRWADMATVVADFLQAQPEGV